MKLSRRGKHTKHSRRGRRHTKRAGKHLRYRSKKVRASKRYHHVHKRTYKSGRRFQMGGVKCDTMIKMEWWERDASTNSYSTVISSVYLKYLKQMSFSKGESNSFKVVLKISDNGTTIDIKFIRQDDKAVEHSITDFKMLSSPGLSKWRNKEGQNYNFDFPENQNVFRCIREAIEKKKKVITDPLKTVTENDRIMLVRAATRAKYSDPTEYTLPKKWFTGEGATGISGASAKDFEEDEFIGRYTLNVNDIDKMFDIYIMGRLHNVIMLLGIPSNGNNYDNLYEIAPWDVLPTDVTNPNDLSLNPYTNIYDESPVMSTTPDIFPGTRNNIANFIIFQGKRR